MKQISVLAEGFLLRDFPFEKLDKASFSHVDLVNVTLRVHENIKDTISNRFGENCLTPDGDRFYIAHVLMACSYLLSLANNCVCLEPESLKSRMRQLLEQIYSQYHSTYSSC